MSAAEVVRCAERCMGLAIRKGQAEGRIETVGDARSRAGKISRGSNTGVDSTVLKTPVSAIASRDELIRNHAGIYHLTDSVSDEQFEGALAEAKNVQRLDLTTLEQSHQMVAAAEEAEEEVSRRVRAKPRSPNGGRPAGGARAAARELGVPESTIRGAKKHVQAAELKRRAERRLGELLAETDTTTRPRSHDGTLAPGRVLPDGVSKMQSHRWQMEEAVW